MTTIDITSVKEMTSSGRCYSPKMNEKAASNKAVDRTKKQEVPKGKGIEVATMSPQK